MKNDFSALTKINALMDQISNEYGMSEYDCDKKLITELKRIRGTIVEIEHNLEKIDALSEKK